MPAKKENEITEAKKKPKKTEEANKAEKTDKAEEDVNLEEAFNRLEEAAASLEREDISLEESFQIYKNGMELLKKCNDAIDRVEKKVLLLNENGETDEF